jgi:hypothetical protein
LNKLEDERVTSVAGYDKALKGIGKMRNINVVDKIDRKQLSQGGWCFSCGKRLTPSEIHAVTDSGLYLHFFATTVGKREA